MFRTEYEANAAGFSSVRPVARRTVRKVPPMIGTRFITIVAACTLAALFFATLMH